MRLRPDDLPAAAIDFLTERHLATLTTLRADGSPHVVAIAFTFDAATATARVITSGPSLKARNVGAGGPTALCQVEGRRWLTLEGRGVVITDPDEVQDAVQRYAVRFRQPRVNPQRVLVKIAVDRVMGNI